MVSPIWTCIAYFAAIPLCLLVRVLTRRPGERPLHDLRGTAIPVVAILAMLSLGEIIYPALVEQGKSFTHQPFLVTLGVIALFLIIEALRLKGGRGWLQGRSLYGFVLFGLLFAAGIYLYFHFVFQIYR